MGICRDKKKCKTKLYVEMFGVSSLGCVYLFVYGDLGRGSGLGDIDMEIGISPMTPKTTPQNPSPRNAMWQTHLCYLRWLVTSSMYVSRLTNRFSRKDFPDLATPPIDISMVGRLCMPYLVTVSSSTVSYKMALPFWKSASFRTLPL